MTEEQNINSLINNLDERTKELHCIYHVDEALNDFDSDIELVLEKVIALIPEGLRFTDICKAKITYEGLELISDGYKETELKLSSRIMIDNKVVGEIAVVYIKPIKTEKRIFLIEEITLINTIATKLSNFFLLRRLRQTIKEIEGQSGVKAAHGEDSLYTWLKDLCLTDEEIEKFTHIKIKFKKGENMCKQGSITSYIMLLSEGLSKNYLEGIQERGFNFSIVKPYDFIGLSSLYGSVLYNFSGAALIPCSVFIIENNLFKKTIQNNPEFAQNILKWYCNTTERHLKRLSCIANKQSLGRMAEILLYLKDDIFNSNIIKGYISRKDIAELAAISTESAVRILSELKKDKIINIINNNDIEILNDKLLKILSMAG
jgi:CRP-like cAMP-binding protein